MLNFGAQFRSLKIQLTVISKTNQAYLKIGVDEYLNRLKHYCKIDYVEISDIKNAKNLNQVELKKKEAEKILAQVEKSDTLILLDENGKSFSSVGFSEQLSKWQHLSIKRLHFIVGGAYGFDRSVLERAQSKISLSKMTFSHQMVRLIFLEQLYRAHTILKGEPYHHA